MASNERRQRTTTRVSLQGHGLIRIGNPSWDQQQRFGDAMPLRSWVCAHFFLLMRTKRNFPISLEESSLAVTRHWFGLFLPFAVPAVMALIGTRPPPRDMRTHKQITTHCENNKDEPRKLIPVFAACTAALPARLFTVCLCRLYSIHRLPLPLPLALQHGTVQIDRSVDNAAKAWCSTRPPRATAGSPQDPNVPQRRDSSLAETGAKPQMLGMHHQTPSICQPHHGHICLRHLQWSGP